MNLSIAKSVLTDKKVMPTIIEPVRALEKPKFKIIKRVEPTPKNKNKDLEELPPLQISKVKARKYIIDFAHDSLELEDLNMQNVDLQHLSKLPTKEEMQH